MRQVTVERARSAGSPALRARPPRPNALATASVSFAAEVAAFALAQASRGATVAP
jgi:hypothetical protein